MSGRPGQTGTRDPSPPRPERRALCCFESPTAQSPTVPCNKFFANCPAIPDFSCEQRQECVQRYNFEHDLSSSLAYMRVLVSHANQALQSDTSQVSLFASALPSEAY